MIEDFTEPSPFKPVKHQWAYDHWKSQQQQHWIPEEVEFGQDIEDWQKISDNERNLLTNIFRYFTQGDIDVAGGYCDKFIPYFKNTELRMMLSTFASMETIHIDAYALLISTVNMPDTEFNAFNDYKEMSDKHEYLNNFNMNSPIDVLVSIAVFACFTEGLQLFGSFTMLLNFSRFNLMKGMCQVVTWSIRDETIHVSGMVRLFHAFKKSLGIKDSEIHERITDIASDVVKLEEAFINLAFEMGDQKGLTAQETKQYIRYLCDWRLKNMGIKPIFNIKEHPLPWLIPLINTVEHANFFEARATEYSKSSTTGAWGDAW
ncbi:ribonucleotide-diphosphate reductase subunit beta [Flavobacteriaceae bacterium (ex Bugula neritina AB1)]|nr:ribonucleotide-diphosphate reductase subunit beta [Flavobacteriaceae bacterium (ex Bugula neritina AB1)]